jgi:endonuclease/exonuclease/phosphatase family metal-dependent hydrolase
LRFLLRAWRAFAPISLVFLVSCITAPLQPREPTPGVPHLTVMTYNVHQDRWNDASTVAAIGAAGADIVCLQEISAAWARVIKERYAAQYPVMLFAPAEDHGGLAILSKYPLEDRGVLLYGAGFHPGWNVTADTPGGRVQVVHVHLRPRFEGDSDPLSNFFTTESDHVAELELFLSKTDPQLPTLVLGDFNESPKGDAVRRLESRGFRNALPLYRPGQFTWQGKSVAALFDMCIDHVMFDGSFEPLSSWVDGSGGSDHLPVLASLELLPRAAAP